MKNIQYTASRYFQIKYFFLSILLTGLALPVFSQAEETKEKAEVKSDTAKTEQQEPEGKQSLRVTFEAFKINKDVKLQASVKTKVSGKFQKLAGVEVSFYKGEVTPGNLLGKDVSGHNGEASLIVPMTEKSDSAGSVSYFAEVKDNPAYEDDEETVDVNPSVMDMKLEEEDSTRTAKVFLGAPDKAGKIVPIVGAAVQLYVKRMFGYLPIGESETTDDEGRVAIEFPGDIKGDEAGNLTVVAKVAEHEVVGNVEANQTIAWGIPTLADDFYTKRELWSARSNSPIPLVIIVNTVLIGVWGAIAFIFLEILRINRLGKQRVNGK